MWNENGSRTPRDTEVDTATLNTRALINVGFVSALALLVASLMPSALVPPTFAQFLAWASMGASIVALLRGERWNDRWLTGWDQAAMLILLSLVAGMFTDPEAVELALESLGHSAAGGAAAPPPG